MTKVVSFAEYAAHPEQIGTVLQRILAKQKSEVVWVTLDEDARYKISYCPISQTAECQHKGGDYFTLIAKIDEASSTPAIGISKLVSLSNYEKDLQSEELGEFQLLSTKLTMALPKIKELEERLATSRAD